jgi:hypothetical protein
MNKLYLRSFLIALTASLMPTSAQSRCKDAFVVDFENNTAIAYPIEPDVEEFGDEFCTGGDQNGIFQDLTKNLENNKRRRYNTESIVSENLKLLVTDCAHKEDNGDIALTRLTKDNASQVKCNTNDYPSNLVISEGSGSAPATGSPGVGSHSPNTGVDESED